MREPGGEQLQALGDLVVVPAAAVLVVKQHEGARLGPGVAPGVLQQHQRQQRLQPRAAGQQLASHPGQPDAVAGQVHPHRVGAAAGAYPAVKAR